MIIYISKIENRITFKIKTGYYLEFSTPETMKLLGNTQSKIVKNENGENVLHLEITQVMHYSIVNNDYQHNSRVLSAFVPNRSFRQLLDVSHKNSLFLKTLNSEFSYIKLRFTGRNSKPLEIENEISITLVVN